MVEFTGERVVPGQVSDDLWSEHFARYAFARRYATGKRVLDAGCGTGYGTAELAFSAARVIGLDASPEALQFALQNCSIPGTAFVHGSAMCMPFRKAAFDLVVAFEVIEHLRDYRTFIGETARVLASDGLFIVSSPNKLYYAESRGKTGPNPFHEHEFEAQEFVEELRHAFPHALLLVQNRVESFAFHPVKTLWPSDARVDGGAGTAADAHFLIALCSFQPLTDLRCFVYVPKAANILREREQHVQLLEKQLAQTQQWLQDTSGERDELLAMFRKEKQELEEHNRWAEQLNAELKAASERIVHLQEELETVSAGYEAKVRELEGENQAKTEWALDTEARLTQEIQQKTGELADTVSLLQAAEQTVEERTLWAQRAEARREHLAAQLNLIRASRWIKFGRKMGVGPMIQENQEQ